MSRLEAAARRMGIRLSPEATRQVTLPHLSDEAIERLEAIFPVRLLEPGEDLDAFRHYCGAAQLVQDLKAVTRPAPDDPTSEEHLDAEAVGRAIAQTYGVPYEED